jgi:hypothetical protein
VQVKLDAKLNTTMTKLLITGLLCLLFLQNHAQVEDKNIALGINATGFVSKFISPNDNFSIIEQTPLGFWGYFGNVTAFRAGIGLNYNNRSTSSNVSDQTLTENAINALLRLGVERRIRLADRTKLILGADVIGNFTESKIVTNGTFDTTTVFDKSTSVGLGFIGGLQFNFSSRIGIRSEAGINLLYSEGTSGNESVNFPSINTNSNVKGTSVNMDLLNALVLVVHL